MLHLSAPLLAVTLLFTHLRCVPSPLFNRCSLSSACTWGGSELELPAVVTWGAGACALMAILWAMQRPQLVGSPARGSWFRCPPSPPGAEPLKRPREQSCRRLPYGPETSAGGGRGDAQVRSGCPPRGSGFSSSTTWRLPVSVSKTLTHRMSIKR